MAKLDQKTSFGLVAKEYQKYRRTYDPRLYKLLFSLLPKDNLSILDIGCGTGKSTEPLITHAGKRSITVTGIDPDERMLREARVFAKKQKLPIAYIKGTAEKLSFKERQFDAVISGAAFHWYGNQKTVANIKKVLKEKGVLFIFWTQFTKTNKETIGKNVFQKYPWQGFPQKFRRNHSNSYITKLLSETGFKKIKSAKIPFTETKTVPHIIGNMKTNSSYAIMSPRTKEKFIQEMTEAYMKVVGNRKYVTDKMELLVCYGFK